MSNNTCVICAVIMFVALCAAVAIHTRPVPVVAQTNLEKLPVEIMGYIATEASFSDAVNKELNADKYVYRHYKTKNGDQFDLYVGYYGTAKGGRTGHNPYACLSGAGWAIVEARKVNIRIPSLSPDVEVNYILARRDGVNSVMIHWYQTGGTKIISTGLEQNIERFWDRVLHNRNDGAFVQVITHVSDDQVVVAKEKVQDFAGQILQILPGYWPIEK